MTLDELEQNVRENPDDAWLADDMLALIARLRATEAAHAEHVSALGALVERAYREGCVAYAEPKPSEYEKADAWSFSFAKAALDRLREGA